MHLILFDIDGTLMHTHGAGRKSFISTLRGVFGIEESMEDISFAGATDLNVLHDVLKRWNIEPTEAEKSLFFERLPEAMLRNASADNATLYPGVKSLLQELHDHEQCMLGIVTGNAKACAMIKLGLFDLEPFFSVGAYGDEDGNRNILAQIALQRAQALSPSSNGFADIFLIGDSPSDIEAARELSATSIAVTTGFCTRDVLAEAGADHLMDGLSDSKKIIHLLTAGNPD